MRRIVLAWLVSALAVGLTACGSSSASGTSGASNANAQTIKFSQCMRSHGLPNFPDPSGNGELAISPSSGFDPQSPAFQSAQQACQKLLPGGGGLPPQMSESDKVAALRFAKCMRSHGVPGFPDPDLSPSGNGPVIALRGMRFQPGPGLNPLSPGFRQAAARCGIRLPAGP